MIYTEMNIYIYTNYMYHIYIISMTLVHIYIYIITEMNNEIFIHIYILPRYISHTNAYLTERIHLQGVSRVFAYSKPL